jgi:hypothetical protein
VAACRASRNRNEKDRHAESSAALAQAAFPSRLVFTPRDLPIASHRDLKGKRIMIGT